MYLHVLNVGILHALFLYILEDLKMSFGIFVRGGGQ